jgi:TonB-linked SusC/RagA family outer membrane protein
MKKRLFFKLWKKSSVMLLFFTMLSMQQTVAQGAVNGTVTDESDIGVPGANVVVKNTNNGAVTDFDGKFSINASKGDVLVISFLGYNTQEVVVGNQTSINVKLDQDLQSLDEVVIVGYGSQKKSDLTGAVGTISAKDISKFTFSNPAQALQGKMAGVSVQSQGGAPGGNAVISIRGFGSLSDAGPLFVIDGMLTGSMSSVNPSDIESVSVLKDASASAIYGSRAANGVVIITTKKGKRGKVNVELDANYGFQKAINTFDWANNVEYAQIVNQANDNDGVSRIPANDADFNPNNGSNLYDESLRTSTVQNTNLRISGGGENTIYSLSLNQFEDEGIVKYSDFKRTTARANANIKKGRLNVQSTIGFTKTVNNPNPYFNKERNLLPTINLKDENGDWNVSDAPAGQGLGQFYGQGTIYNELALAAIEDRTVTRNTVLGNIAASFEIVDGLTYKLNLGLEYYNNDNYKFRPIHPIFDATGGSGFDELAETKVTFQSTLIEHTLNYKKTISKHTIDLLGGFTEQKNESSSRGITAQNFPSAEIHNAETAASITIDNSDNTSAIQSYFGRLNYSFDDKYILTGTLRRDGSSLFVKDLRWGTFPSLAVGWNISNETFMENFDAISNIKLRASYGEIGSNNVPVYSTDPSLNLNSEYILGGGSQTRVTGYSVTRGVNKNITWETTKTTDIGLEFTALNRKLNVTLDYFIKESEDVLVGLKPPFYVGYGNDIPFNTASIENKGFEFLANYNDNFGDLKFSASANFSVVNNEVTSLGPASPIIQGSFTSNTINSTKTDVGQPISSFFGYVLDGIYQTDAEATAANDQAGSPVAGDLKFKDIAGPDGSGPDGVIDENDRTYIGNPTPNFEYGINVSAEYKNFDLSLFFNGVSGNEILNGTKYRGIFDFNGNYFADRLNSWTPTNTNTNVPRNTRTDGGFNRRMSSYYLENGAYFRLRNAQIGYSLPNDVLGKVKLEKVRLYVSATNLFTITDYTGYYPEVGRNGRNANGRSIFNSGVDEGSYPTPRNFQLGLQVSF